LSIQRDSLNNLREQIASGFLIAEHREEGGVHHFILPALEYNAYTISIPDGAEVRKYIASDEFARAKMVPIKIGVALLDLVGFSANADEVQLKMIVRYQCEVRKAIGKFSVTRMLSIGDGTIFIFEDNAISSMPECMMAIDHAIAGFNLDSKWDGVPEIIHRMGAHVGMGYCFRDINRDQNYIGTGVNMAQRISTLVPDMDDQSICFELRSPIYVSIDAKAEYENRGLPAGIRFFDAGVQPVKHGIRVHVYALCRETKESIKIRLPKS